MFNNYVKKHHPPRLFSCQIQGAGQISGFVHLRLVCQYFFVGSFYFQKPLRQFQQQPKNSIKPVGPAHHVCDKVKFR